MNILEAVGLLLVGVALGYGFRALIGKELVAVKDRLASIESKVKGRL